MTIFIKKAMQEVAEKLKNWKYAAIRKEITENNEDWNNFYAAWSGITNSESFVPPSWLTDQLWHTCVPHQALIASSSRKLGREVGMPRNTRENMIFAGNASHRQHAQRDPEELHNYSRNLATLLEIAVDVEDSEKSRKLRIVGAKNHCNQYLYLAFQKERVENVYTTNRSYVYDLPCLGYLDLYSSGMTIPVISTRKSISISLTE